MDYQPNPNSNISKILNIIPTDSVISLTELKNRLTKKEKSFPLDSVYVHTKFLAKKGIIFIAKIDGENNYSQNKNLLDSIAPSQTEIFKTPINKKKKLSRSKQVLIYCQQHVGKRISSKEVRAKCGKNANDSAPLDNLKRLKDGGYIQLIPDTSPYEYLVLPEIKTIEKIPRNNSLPSVIQKKNHIPEQQTLEKMQSNIANMSLSDIVSDYVRLQQENQRMKDALQRMGMEFLQLGIME